MRGTVAQWGPSLAVRIPDSVAADAQLADGTEVEIALEGGRVVLTPVPPATRAYARTYTRTYRLRDLLAGITDDNQHPELFADAPRGAEGW